MKQQIKFCNHFNQITTREEVNHILHAVLSLLTGGWWIIVWLILASKEDKCTKCGN